MARPLTELDEEQQLFREAVLGFARERIGPLVHKMDAEAHIDASLLPGLFALGVMGIEIPEEYGGSGSTFFNAILAVEALATVDASLSVLVDVQNTLVANALLRWGTISPADLSLFHVADTPADAFEYLTRELVTLYGEIDAEATGV